MAFAPGLYSGLFADIRSDDADVVTAIDGANTRFESIPNRGSGGGTVNGTLNAGAFPVGRPLRQTSFFGGRASCGFGFDRRLFSSLANSAWSLLHDASDSTVVLRVCVNGINGSTGLYYSNMTGVGGNVGVHLKVGPSGQLITEYGNGSTIQAFTSPNGTIVAGDTDFTIAIVKATSGGTTTATTYVNGVQGSTGTIASPSAAAPTNQFCYGGYIASTANSSGANFGRFLVYSQALTPAQLSRLDTYLTAEWP